MKLKIFFAVIAALCAASAAVYMVKRRKQQ